MPSFQGNLLTQWHEITSYETRDSRLSYGEDPESLSRLALNPYRQVSALSAVPAGTDVALKNLLSECGTRKQISATRFW